MAKVFRHRDGQYALGIFKRELAGDRFNDPVISAQKTDFGSELFQLPLENREHFVRCVLEFYFHRFFIPDIKAMPNSPAPASKIVDPLF